MINVAFIGAGRVTTHHFNMLAEVPEVRAAALSDLKQERGKPLSEQWGVPYYANYHEMFARHPEIDLVVIATPSGMHFEHTMEVMGRYGKSVLVEKPTFMRPGQLALAYDCAEAKGLHIFPVYHNRYNRAVTRARQAVQAGELGDIRMASVRLRWCRPQRYYDRDPWRGTWSHDGGAMTNQGVHYIDLLRHLGGEVRRVNARCATLGVEVEVEDTSVATFEFANGGLGVIEITTAARPDDFEASISLVGSRGMAVVAGEATNTLVTFTPDPGVCQAASEVFPIIYGWGHREIYRDIARVLRGEGAFPIDRQDAARTLELLHALYRSDEVGNWVEVGPQTVSERLGRPDEAMSAIYRTPAPQPA